MTRRRAQSGPRALDAADDALVADIDAALGAAERAAGRRLDYARGGETVVACALAGTRT